MTSSTTTNNPSNVLNNETTVYEYMRQFVDYQENGIDLNELSQIRQLDIYLQNCYNRVRELVNSLRNKQPNGTQSESDIQNLLINTLIQAKAIGDKKMQLSQQMLDTTERQSKKLKIAYQKYVESINQQSTSSESNTNEVDSENEFDSEMNIPRSLSTKTSTTSLWKRKTTTNSPSTSTINLKRKCVTNTEHNNDPRERKKPTQRNTNSNTQNTNSGYNKKLKLNNDSSLAPSDEPTYCLCSQLSYGSMILCDSKSCEIKWFHFNCVNLTTKPKGKWFCPNCRDNRS
ncbi:unnamed protein product [Rotaria socialis]|uniref:Inhibitor of growth protein n=1 Tax=Rotaria socialis TaxID=392032 RepID=A0A817N5U4_9BILA|nr:unnamed protein product [Rotaria socialis]CAF3311938.1 unnamed protein product [Rotaria socialis]CAF3325399.1 unnamed protein product [Rotaria socialis]CAF3347748.1 unnamed protein product [Rotaria socialis]CAF3409532.1 unnamed protein product [Rotaria socialis]